METHDFVKWLEPDMSLNILMRLNDPADIVRAASVSRLWLQFVATNGISKQLCLRKFPQLSSIACITEPDMGVAERKDEPSNSSWEALKRDHNVYACLLQDIEKSKLCPSDCIGNAVRASSTDHYPAESIVNTLVPSDRHRNMPSYWSSIGHSDPNASETLIYKLKADLCCVTEICIQPFEVYFFQGRPICSGKSVRFRFGHLKSSRDKTNLLHFPLQQPADDKFIWTYTSEEFHMRQENRLQHFKFPEPVLCIGGYLQIELLGIAERCDIDNLFYICINHVKVRGRPLSPAFGVQTIELSGDFVLKPQVQQRGSLIHVASSLIGFIQDSNKTSAWNYLLDFGPMKWNDNAIKWT